jgi:RNA polymerase sigma factor (TIGR02999 family)
MLVTALLEVTDTPAYSDDYHVCRAAMGEITQWLQDAAGGNRSALSKVFHQLYPELKKIAAARFSGGANTLSPTALVHESYLRLIGNETLSLQSRLHFLACAGRAMRMIVIDHIRQLGSQKRGANAPHTLNLEGVSEAFDWDWLVLDQALDRLNLMNPDLRELIELHFFAGVEFQDIAKLRGVDERTVRRHWQRAKSFLHQWL